MKRVRNQWPLLRVVLRYHGIVTKLVYVCYKFEERHYGFERYAQLHSKCMPLFFTIHSRYFSFTSARRSTSSVWICAEKEQCLTLISNNAFFHTCMHEALKTVQSFKSERYRKIYNVIRARRSRDGSLTATLYIRVINTYASYNNDFSHGGQTIEWMSCSVTKRDYVKTIWVEHPPNCKAAVLGLSNAL